MVGDKVKDQLLPYHTELAGLTKGGSGLEIGRTKLEAAAVV